MFSAAALGLSWLVASQDAKPVIAICPVEVPGNVRFEGWEKDQSRSILATTIEDVIIEELKKEYIAAEGSKFIEMDIREQKLKPAPKFDFFTKIAGSTQASRILYIQVLDFKQKNHEPGATLHKPNSAGSETKVQLNAWIFEKSEQVALTLNPTKRLEGDFPGPIFGTTNKLQLSGNPQDVAFMINQENTKRCRAGGKSVWLALKTPLLTALAGKP